MPDFDLEDFLPYLLNRAAEHTSHEFQAIYKGKYGMLRTEWRILFHLGRYGNMTAKEICERGGLHKTKVSRAVMALEKKRFLKREKLETDKRVEILKLTRQGEITYRDLSHHAEAYQARMTAELSETDMANLTLVLRHLINK